MLVDKIQNTDLNLEEFFHSEMSEHAEVMMRTKESLLKPFQDMCDMCIDALKRGNKIMFFGNGGSAADAQHLATELTVRYSKDRAAIPAIALTTDSSALTAIGNDFGFDHLFSRQLEALGRPGDVVIGITTSGQSQNVINAFEKARSNDIKTIALTGKDGGRLHGISDLMLVVPSNTTARIQEMHITLGQMLCGAIEKSLGLV